MYTHNYLTHRKPSFASTSEQQGLTMIELLITVTILGILLMIAIPSFNRWVVDWRLTNAVNSFRSSLLVARSEAIARRKIIRICPSNGGNGCVPGADYANGWLVYVGNAPGANNTLIVQEGLKGLRSIVPNSNVNLQFVPTGIMRANSGSTFTFTTSSYVDDTSTAWAKKQVTISRTGRVRKL